MKYKVDKSGHCIMPKGIQTIENHEFAFASDITDIEIPDSVTSIGKYAFYDCSGLKAIKIPDGVTSIGDRAFYGCSGLEAIEIPDSVTSIGDGAFAGCDALNSIQVADDNQFYKSVDNCLLSKDGLSLILGCNASIIPNSVTSIGKYAFHGCSGLKAIKIPDGVTSIGDRAFYDCSGLEAIEIPNSVTSIGDGAFYGCNLIAITIHEKNPVKAFLLIQNAGFIKEHITLNVPIGTGYAYRHTPFFAKFKMIIAKVR